ncbi:LCP family protein [Candidatus Saccharibacteria bacterium]|nr:LCP family protein [Candidatus Saccharibacteria bacterium]
MHDNNKKSGFHRKRASLDGFVTDGRRLGVPPNRSYQPTQGAQTPSLDSFSRRADGFHAIRQSPGGLGGTAAEQAETEALLDEPIVLDDIGHDKRKDKVRGKIRRARWRKTLKRTALVLLTTLIVTAGFIGYKFYSTQRQVLSGGGHAPAVCDGDVPVSQLKKEGDGRVNILLLGIGSEGLLTDTIMIASLDPITDKVELLSIPRDLWVNIPGNGQEKINATYEYGWKASTAKSEFEKKRAGMALMDRVLENVTGVTIHYHAVFDFAAFKQIVDALGGISVNVPETLYDPTIAWENHYNPVIAAKGVQQFDGAKALLYAKSRQTSSDFARAERQRLLLVAIKDKALSLGTFSNPIKIIQLMNSLGRNVYSDFDTQSIKCLYTQISQVQSHNIKSLDLVKPPNDLLTTGPLYGRSIVRPKAGLFDYSQVRNYVRTTFRDGFLAKENATVAIYNATSTAGLATTSANILKTFGYNVTVVENAPNQTNPADTVVVDLSKGTNKYTRNYLERRYGVTALSSLPAGLGVSPPQNTDFVIIVGTDANSNN